MLTHKDHKIFIGLASIVVLIIGLSFGVYLTANLGAVELQVINMGLTLASVIILLMIGGIVLEIKEMLKLKKK